MDMLNNSPLTPPTTNCGCITTNEKENCSYTDHMAVELWQCIAHVRDNQNSKDNPAIKQAIIDANYPKSAYEYCIQVGKDEDMRQIIIDGQDAEYIFLYLVNVDEHDNGMRQALIETKNPLFALSYCAQFENDNDMVDIVIKEGGLQHYLKYMRTHGENAEMRQAILESGNTSVAHDYCTYVNHDAEMWKLATSKWT